MNRKIIFLILIIIIMSLVPVAATAGPDATGMTCNYTTITWYRDIYPHRTIDDLYYKFKVTFTGTQPENVQIRHRYYHNGSVIDDFVTGYSPDLEPTQVITSTLAYGLEGVVTESDTAKMRLDITYDGVQTYCLSPTMIFANINGGTRDMRNQRFLPFVLR